MQIAVALGGTDRGRSGIGRFVREILPRIDDHLHRSGGRLVALGTRDELREYGSALRHGEAVAIPERGGAAGNALWHLFWAGGRASDLHADVMLLPAANRRVTWSSAVPAVAVVHDLAQLHVRGKYDAVRMFYATRVLPLALRRAKVLVADSEATRRDLVGSIGISGERIRVVHLGVDTKLFKPRQPDCAQVRAAHRELGIERPYLVYPARLEHPGKNHVRLLHAFARSRLRQTHQLALVGGDWGAGDRIRTAIRDLGLDGAVRLLGYVSDETLSALVAGSVAVLALGLHEGFGLPALEGLATGRPVVASSTGSLPEIVGALGVYCDPLDDTSICAALERVVEDAALQGRAALEGPAWASRFSWDTTAQGLIDACAAALAA